LLGRKIAADEMQAIRLRSGRYWPRNRYQAHAACVPPFARVAFTGVAAGALDVAI